MTTYREEPASGQVMVSFGSVGGDMETVVADAALIATMEDVSEERGRFSVALCATDEEALFLLTEVVIRIKEATSPNSGLHEFMQMLELAVMEAEEGIGREDESREDWDVDELLN